jgi:predicted dehydrogenase
MKALLIGLGSIGRRHLRLLVEMIDCEIICWRSGKEQVLPGVDDKYEVEAFDSLDQAISEKPDFAIIANPTSLHVETALALAKADIPFLIEKPVSDRMEGLDSLKEIVSEKNLPVLVGFQLRHHSGYKQLLELINSGEIGRPLNLQGCVGQYLPDWRPDVDYRQSYSAKKNFGGGVILDLCHEIDIAISILGQVLRVSCICDHYSDLEIETEDMADITMEHQGRCVSHIHLNYLERDYMWVTTVMGSLGTITWDYGKGYVEIVRSGGTSQRWDNPVGFERDWLFRDQLKHWLEVLNGKTPPLVNLDDGIVATQIALAAKRSSVEKRHIDI